MLAHHHPKWSAAKIGAKAIGKGSLEVSSRTIQRYLKAAGYLKLVPRKIPLLTEVQKSNRMMWYKKFIDFRFDNVVFTDESYFQFFRVTQKQWGKSRKESPVPKWSSQIMVWGGVSIRGNTPLVIVGGTMNSDLYQVVLESNLLPTMKVLYPDGFVLQQDILQSQRRSSLKNTISKFYPGFRTPPISAQ
jgi:hypothetical protein